MNRQALELATRVHQNQVDRYGKPYLLHVVRVASRFPDEDDQAAALLHDVVEDSDMTLDGLRAEGFPEEVVHAVDCLTKREGESWPDYIARVEGDARAVRIKLADLEDNMDLRRYPEVKPEDLERINRYLYAYQRLQPGS